MNVGIRAARDQLAQQRIEAATKQLAKQFGSRKLRLNEPDVRTRDAATNAMFEREAIADLLEDIAQLSEKQDRRVQTEMRELEQRLAEVESEKEALLAGNVPPPTTEEINNGRETKD